MAQLLSLFSAIAFLAFASAIPLREADSPIASATTEPRADAKEYRLPTNVQPVSYRIRLAPEFEKFTFDGETAITFKVLTATKTIVLHANETLTISSAKLVMPAGSTTTIPTTERSKKNEFLTITLDQVLPVGQYELNFVFKGKLNDDLEGFYRSNYTNDYGEQRWLATTQFEPTYARRAFPCFDEPDMKATFDISIKHAKNLRALSNMFAVKMETDGTDFTKTITTFLTTPIMSTYLIAFVVSDFESLSNKDGTFNVWAKPNAIRHGKFALETGEKELKELETYTGITQLANGFKKMDQIAIPQFKAGAMENWGLVTYREPYLLVEEGVTNTASRENVATVISHEFAHQWFGNLVSPKWWKYTWLNEGFATYFQYVITDKVLPEWRLKDVQVTAALQTSAFPSDSVSTAVEMNYDANSPEEVWAKFNATSYQKAGSVIRMIAHVIGETKFQSALQAYLKAMSFKSATSDDLFGELVKVFPALPGVTAKPLEILNNWANTPGFPVVQVSRDYEKGTVNITQERYLYKADDAHTETYHVPLNYATASKDFADTTVTKWLEAGKSITNYNVSVDKAKWIVFNKQHFGYYRVNYDEQNWKLITEFLKTKDYADIHVLNRGQLVDDALNLARNGKLKYNVALNLMHFLKTDFDYVPWYSAITGFSHLRRTLANTASYASFKNYLLDLVEPVMKNVKFYEALEDDHLRKLLRVQVLDLACLVGSKFCRDQALTNMTSWLKDSKANPLTPDLKKVILCAGVRSADKATWDKLFVKYSAGEENTLLAALGCSSDANILKGYLTKAMDKSVNTTTRDGIFAAVTTGSEEGVNVALDFVLANADAIYELSGNNTNSLKKYITAIGSKITTKPQLEKLTTASNKYVKDASVDGTKHAEDAVSWLTTHETQFVEYFKKKEPGKGGNNSALTVTVSSILFILSITLSQLY